MAVNVPDEPKKYTTVYDNFKGVDFTNDASNVYKRRSPTGRNMLPDLDGRPYKRTGWDIKFSKEDFIRVSGATGVTNVIPLRTHYFSYGGHDFIMVFNSLGVFWVRDDSTEPVLAQLWDGTSKGEFPPMGERLVDGTTQTVKLTADHNRAFFFEGQGTAGFYVFVDNDLYKFCEVEGQGFLFTNVEPTVPIVIIGAEPKNHVGTTHQSLNMLTDRRTIEYFGDGTSEYALTSVPLSSATTEVQILNSDTGEWEVVPQSGRWSLSGNKITFSSPPEQSVVGNVRITFTPIDNVQHGVKRNFATQKATYTIVKIERYKSYRTVTTRYDEKWRYIDTSASEPTTYFDSSKIYHDAVQLQLPDAFSVKDFKVMSDDSGDDLDRTSSTTISFEAYNSSVRIRLNDEIANTIVDGDPGESPPSAWQNTGGASTVKVGNRWEVYTEQYREITVEKRRVFSVYGLYDKAISYTPSSTASEGRTAFGQCRKCLNFGNDVYSQVFISASTADNYRNRAWYCAANDPAYFPELNYIEVGSDDKSIMGLQKVGSYLGIIKMGSGTEASVYLAYPTSFEEESTYAVKQSVSGIGAISTGAFNILNEEPLFLSDRGVMGINVSETDTNKQIRNRSFYINKKLLAEKNLESAISFAYGGLYYLGINNRCYVLDGSQKTSWANEKTNLQYECYFLDNIPAQCFAKMGNRLYFSDHKGNLCYFKKKTDTLPYVDRYSVLGAQWAANAAPDNGTYDITQLAGTTGEEAYLTDSESDYLVTEESDKLVVMSGLADVNDVIVYGNTFYTVIDVDDKTNIATVAEGVPISAEWSTIADDDGMVHFFKNLNKKGCVVSLLPDDRAYVDISIKADEKDEVNLGYTDGGTTVLPADIFVKKKIKKYKRLQFICRNDWYNDSFALDQIIKTYTVGNYSKNRK